jgi:PhnB protein
VFKSPKSVGRTSVGICLYVEDVDALAKQAVAAGAKELRPVANQFYGDRVGTYQDPFGHVWTIATHIEDVSPEEMMKRAQQAH